MTYHEPRQAASDYRPLALDRWLNFGAAALDYGATPPLGNQTFHGLPFQIGDDVERCFIAPTMPVEIAVAEHAYNVLFLHRLLDSRLLENEPIGLEVADYVFRFDDGVEERIRIRERFEIAAVSQARRIRRVRARAVPGAPRSRTGTAAAR